MSKVSVIIPAKNEEFLENTIRSILDAARGDIEVIVFLDGYLPNPIIEMKDERVVFMYHPEGVGQRGAINLAVADCTGDYILKTDAHSMLSDGFDIELVKACEPDMTIIPRMYNLHAFDWVCMGCGATYGNCGEPKECEGCKSTAFEYKLIWTPKWHKVTDHMWIDKDLRVRYFDGPNLRPYKYNKSKAYFRRQDKGDIQEVMTGQGACWFMSKARYNELGGMDEGHGSWGQMGCEVAMKSWLSGGRQVVHKGVWFSHLFRVSKGYGFPYKASGKDHEAARKYSRGLWLNNQWPQQVHDIDWLIKKFGPVPGWQDAQDDATVGVVYISANKEPEAMINYTLKRLIENKGDAALVAVTHEPVAYENNIVVGRVGCSAQNQLRQILLGCQALDTDMVVMAETDCLYPPEYFKESLGGSKVAYFDSIWMLVDNQFVKKAKPSQCAMLANREYLIKGLEDRLKDHPGWSSKLETGKAKIPNFAKEATTLTTATPIVNIHHSNNMHTKLTGVVGDYVKKLPFWGFGDKLRGDVTVSDQIFMDYKFNLITRNVTAFFEQMPDMIEPSKLGDGPGSGNHFISVFVPFIGAVAEKAGEFTDEELKRFPYYDYLGLKLHSSDRDPLTRGGCKHIISKMRDAIGLYRSIKTEGMHTPIDVFYHKNRQVIVRGGRRLIIAKALGVESVFVRRYKSYHDFLASMYITDPRSGGRIEKVAQRRFCKYGRKGGPNKYYMHNYPVYYDRHLSVLDSKKGRLNILEIGVQNGYSMMLWREAYPKARIVGLDIDPRCKNKRWAKESKAEIIIGDQTDDKVLGRLVEMGPFDLIIDDGCHHPTAQLKTLMALWPAVKCRGLIRNTPGFYIVEDCFHSYRDQVGAPELFSELTNRIRQVYTGQVASVNFYPNTTIIEKV